MPDYQNGKIYKILNNIDGEIYVGSTIETLGQRMAKHRGSMKQRPHYKLYKHMHELNVENFYIELIENYPCNDVYELRAREGYYIREIGTLNKNVAGRTPRESVNICHNNNIEKYKEYKKQYWDTHKEKYNEEKRKYRLDNKDEVNEKRRSRYQENKELSKAYYNKTKERIKQQHSEIIQCSICGCHLNKGSISAHQKSKKCKSCVKPIENEE